MEEKGNLQGEAAARRARERGTRVHFCSGVSARRLQRALAREHRGGESPSSERPGEGSERRDPSAPAGARSPPAWPARGAAGGAPREGPRSHAGCPTKSCRTCRDPAMAVSTRGARGNGRSWGDPPFPEDCVGEGTRGGGNGCAPWRESEDSGCKVASRSSKGQRTASFCSSLQILIASWRP